jgi:hypothetical protein
MNWKVKHYQNDESKHIELWHSIFDELGQTVIYYILPQYQSDDWFVQKTELPPELYIVFFGSARKCTKQEKSLPSYKDTNIDDYVIEIARYFRAFKNLEEAKVYCEELRARNKATMEFVKSVNKKDTKKKR